MYPKLLSGGALFFARTSGDSFSWRCQGSAIRHGSKNKPNFNLMCSVLFRLIYRYFMLQDGLFLFIFTKIQNIIFCLIGLKNRGFNLFFSEKLR
ncbi:Uncharacterised protein [Klebsiella pneumoniae]|uniref:Uncharacterized protein n=1 Tax=Klebsiella pneumoniae TaxID=573 RepID=A0A377XH87_KLEPN|nr:Uncharacterised protein [Klebsiella pneumoniae]